MCMTPTPPADSAAIPSEIAYESRIVYNPERIHGAAIYCSDGRVGEHFDDFLFNGQRLPRYDRLALPGGPACLAGHREAEISHAGLDDELRFLVEAHGLDRVILIAHAGCAFYKVRLGIDEDDELERVQRADLVVAAAKVREVTRVPHVEAFFARPADGRVRFEAVPVP